MARSKYNTETWIEAAKKVHGNKWTYDKTKYINAKTKVCITCPKHGDFWQFPTSHLQGYGCKKCAIEKDTFTKEKFVELANLKHGNKYIYTNTVYNGALEYLDIECPIHGTFKQKAYSHLQGHGCPKCAAEKNSENLSFTKEKVIQMFKKVHGDKYSYDNMDYKNMQTKIAITCKKHGDFYQKPLKHLQGHGCPLCNQSFKKDVKTFIAEANAVHNFKYCYDKSVYETNHTYLTITCPIHGDFKQTPAAHLSGQGCPKCGIESRSEIRRKSLDQFITEAKGIYGDKYDYSDSAYVNANTPISIKCKEHGIFYITPHSHLRGGGCPKCNCSILEQQIRLLLEENKIDHSLKVRNLPWLERLELDFYLPQYNIAIECQGLQHFKPVEIFGGEKVFKELVERDKRKRKLCNENGVKLLYYSNLGIKYPYEVFEDKEKLLEEILKSEDFSISLQKTENA